jgi:hypothetical protein
MRWRKSAKADVFDHLLRREEAQRLASDEKRDFVRAFVKQALHTAHRIVIAEPGGRGIRPVAPVDLVFVAEVGRAMAESPEILRRFLNGNFLDDFGDPI